MLPLDSTHKLQPLDQTFIGPLQTNYSDEIRRCTRAERYFIVREIKEAVKSPHGENLSNILFSVRSNKVFKEVISNDMIKWTQSLLCDMV